MGSKNLAKLDFNRELQQVVEKLGWFFQQSGGGMIMTWRLFYTISCQFGEWESGPWQVV